MSVSVMSRHGVLDFEATLDVVQRALKLLLPGVLALFDEMAFGRERDQVRRAPEAIPAA